MWNVDKKTEQDLDRNNGTIKKCNGRICATMFLGNTFIACMDFPIYNGKCLACFLTLDNTCPNT